MCPLGESAAAVPSQRSTTFQMHMSGSLAELHQRLTEAVGEGWLVMKIELRDSDSDTYTISLRPAEA